MHAIIHVTVKVHILKDYVYLTDVGVVLSLGFTLRGPDGYERCSPAVADSRM